MATTSAFAVRPLRPSEQSRAAVLLAERFIDDPRNAAFVLQKGGKHRAKILDFLARVYFPFFVEQLLASPDLGEAWALVEMLPRRRGRGDAAGGGEEAEGEEEEEEDAEKLRGVALWLSPGQSKSPLKHLDKLAMIVAKSVRKFPRQCVKFGLVELKFTFAVLGMAEHAGKRALMLLFVAVDESVSSRGLGKKLVDAVLDREGEDDGVAAAPAATTFCTNERNVKFFASLGFENERILTEKFDGIKCKTWLFVRAAGYRYPEEDRQRQKLESAAASASSLVSDSDFWMIPYVDLELGKELASGNFGAVFQGLYRGNDCVVKRLHDKSEEARLELLKEADAMARVRPHASVCAFYGVCAAPDSPLCVVTELVAGGNLLERLRTQAAPITSRDVLHLSRDLASGLQHIHHFSLVHADVAARNCLVVGIKPLRLRICDFGLSRAIVKGETLSCASQSFPVRWAPPETWTKLEMSTAFDVWGFGITVWEILSGGKVPYRNLTANRQVMQFVADGGRLGAPQKVEGEPHLRCGDELFDLVQTCWQEDPSARPPFSKIVQDLSALMRKFDDGLSSSLSSFSPDVSVADLLANLDDDLSESDSMESSASSGAYYTVANGKNDASEPQTNTALSEYGRTPSHVGALDSSNDYGRTPSHVGEAEIPDPTTTYAIPIDAGSMSARYEDYESYYTTIESTDIAPKSV